MTSIHQVTAKIFADMPAETRFGDQDAACLAKHRDLLLGLEDTIVKGFYDVLFAHSKTADILNKDGREKREMTLRNWWQKTLNSEFDDEYWEWQVFVGLVHIKQKVTNPMMISMWGWLLIALRSALQDQLPPAEYILVLNAFGRLATSIQALIAESVMLNRLQAITDATGFNPKLMDRLVDLQIDGMIKQSRKGSPGL
jgi:hypothetical protein